MQDSISEVDLLKIKLFEQEVATLKAQAQVAMTCAEKKAVEFSSHMKDVWNSYGLRVGKDEIDRDGKIKRAVDEDSK